MHDYHPLIVRAVSKLESNTSDARRALFQQARIILIDQLRIRQPTASDSEIMRERAALEDAIRKVEIGVRDAGPTANNIGTRGPSQVR